MRKKIKVLYVTAEISPYANTGGLGEVGKSFPEALSEGDVEVRRVMPLYKGIGKMKYVTDFVVSMEQGYETGVLKTDPDNKGVLTYFIQNDRYFYRDNLYAYEDDGIRFFFFCKAVVEMLKRIPFKPDIVHMNDWHTGILTLLLKKEFTDIKTVYTIHNIAYSGYIPHSYLTGVITETEMYRLGYPEWLDFLKAGIIYSDLLTTVSPGYKEEIEKQALNRGISSLLELRQRKLIGILNGVDTDIYNPMMDKILDYPFDSTKLDQKEINKAKLREELGLSDTNKPLVAMVTRLDYTKGIDLLIKTVKATDLSTFQLVVLGSGSPYYQGLLASIAADYKGDFAVRSDYSAALAIKIYAAADLYLMPSLSEPCGLGQLYAMRYGAVPVVNPVGGLRDSVVDDREHPENSSGFFMENWSAEGLTNAILRAVAAYHSTEWSTYMMNGMHFDSSWKHSIQEYINYYKEILNS